MKKLEEYWQARLKKQQVKNKKIIIRASCISWHLQNMNLCVPVIC
jgi:hypothetical protein